MALTLRKTGRSLNEISSALNVSKGSVSLWVRNVRLSEKAQRRILQRRELGIQKAKKVRLARTAERLEEAARFATAVLSRVVDDKDNARLACALLYWCEGEKTKSDKSLVFTNSDSLLVKAFLRTLRKGYEVDERKFRVCIHLHSYHIAKQQLLFWSKVTTIPITQFIRPYQKSNSGKNVRMGYAGCASIRYHDVRIARQVQATARAFLKR